MAKTKPARKRKTRAKVTYTDKKHTAALNLLAQSCCYGHAKSVLGDVKAKMPGAASVGNKAQRKAAGNLLKECNGKLAVATRTVGDWQDSGFGGFGGSGGWPGD